jgi:hypothetical protein
MLSSFMKLPGKPDTVIVLKAKRARPTNIKLRIMERSSPYLFALTSRHSKMTLKRNDYK